MRLLSGEWLKRMGERCRTAEYDYFNWKTAENDELTVPTWGTAVHNEVYLEDG